MMGEQGLFTWRLEKGFVWAVMLALTALAGCSGSIRVLEQAERRPYDWESHAMHPQAVWHQFQKDSLRLFVELPLAELLFTRNDATEPFRYSARVEVALQPRLADGRFAGTPRYSSWDLTDTAATDQSEVRVHFDVALDGGDDPVHFWSATWVLTDLHRDVQTGGEEIVTSAPGSRSHAVLAVNPETGQPLYGKSAVTGSIVRMLVPGGGRWELSFLDPELKLPAPPYVRRKTNSPVFSDSLGVAIEITRAVSEAAPEAGPAFLISGANYSDWAYLQWNVAAGPQRAMDNTSGMREVLVGRAAHFPEVRDVDEMIATARYIATRKEFNVLDKAAHPKLALDEFWLACDSDLDDARALIRTYYRRVHEANAYFSGLRDGWMTDRGLVHILFGPPGRVRRSRDMETWIYGDETNVNAIIFQFRSRDRGDAFNVFELDRSVAYRAPWDARVKNWRNGRISTD